MMSDLVTVAGPAVAAAVAWILARRQNRAIINRTDAQAAHVIQASALGLITPLRAQIAEANHELDQLRVKVRRQSAELDRAHAYLAAHGIDLPPAPQ